MKKTFSTTWHRADHALEIIAVIAILICLAVVGWQTIRTSTLWPLILLILLTPLVAWLILQRVTSVELTDDCLVLHHRVGKTRIQRSHIQSACAYTGEIGIRLCGFGGIQGFIGWFRADSIGVYRAYIGDPTNMILLTQLDGKKIIFSCDNSAELIQSLR